ncbi:MAG: two-component system response regulator BaeR, partial [Rhodoferax sp.]|nr:two-component system response regulator BaeR [Rhodoferax sp.]
LGLDTGDDDYVCNPFSPRQVLARIRALLRRSDGSLAAAAAALPDGLRLDEAGQRVLWRGAALPLTGLEYRLLRLLMGRPGAVFSRAQLLDAAHSDLRDVSDRAIDSHVKNLRRKLEAAGCQDAAIDSVYGVGYRFEAG